MDEVDGHLSEGGNRDWGGVLWEVVKNGFLGSP